MRNPRDITHGGTRLSDILSAHGADLRGANLHGADLHGADLRDANLRGADLRGANLSGANLSAANLSGANLSDANLSAAYLSWANLSWANLSWANLSAANLSAANLSDANLNHATGNMREVKSAHFDRWAVTWITSPDGEVAVQIECQRHPLALWEKSDPRWIATLDRDAPEWWGRYRDVVLTLVKASPAIPHGAAKNTDGAEADL